MKEMLGMACISLGVFVHLSAVVGMFRFRYVLNRMHAATLADTLGIGLVLLGCIALRGSLALTGKFILLLVFLWLTAPISGHLIARSEVMLRPKRKKETEDETGI
ncbi:MAG: monovalent cation/H(+) antiporter subunit G [Oscillospiraceae bacterium]|nr:monovalent cation/H(+) antiporter subunit G [Oscillospiraceae bacterium]